MSQDQPHSLLKGRGREAASEPSLDSACGGWSGVGGWYLLKLWGFYSIDRRCLQPVGLCTWSGHRLSLFSSSHPTLCPPSAPQAPSPDKLMVSVFHSPAGNFSSPVSLLSKANWALYHTAEPASISLSFRHLPTTLFSVPAQHEGLPQSNRPPVHCWTPMYTKKPILHFTMRPSDTASPP